MRGGGVGVKAFGCVSGLVAAVVALVIVPISAAADNFKISGSYSFTANHLCADPIRIEGSYDEMVHTFYDNSGNAVRMSFTGKVTVKYTNLSTGKTYSPNSSGPGTLDLATGQTVARGGNGTMFDSNGNLIATDGRVVLDASFNIISIVGHQTDVCTKLGS